MHWCISNSKQDLVFWCARTYQCWWPFWVTLPDSSVFRGSISGASAEDSDGPVHIPNDQVVSDAQRVKQWFWSVQSDVLSKRCSAHSATQILCLSRSQRWAGLRGRSQTYILNSDWRVCVSETDFASYLWVQSLCFYGEVSLVRWLTSHPPSELCWILTSVKILTNLRDDV